MNPYESQLLDSTDGFQCKVYANSHPDTHIIVKPKYLLASALELKGMRKRFLFSTCMTRFNLFTNLEDVKYNIAQLKKHYPEYVYACPNHQNWFLAVPKDKIAKTYDTREGLRQLMMVPYKDLDQYLKAVHDLVNFLLTSGMTLKDLGISHSTLLGNYTPGRSDIDIVVFGLDNGWKTLKFLETATHEKLKWKTKEEWAKYYQDRVVSKYFSEQEYVTSMVRKRDDGLFDGHVFSLFVVESPEQSWYDWDDKHEPLGEVTLKGIVKDDHYAVLRPGYYELSSSEIIAGHDDIPVTRVVTWSRPFLLQAKPGETIEASGLLEKVMTKKETFYQVVLGYFDSYTTGRGEREYIKVREE